VIELAQFDPVKGSAGVALADPSDFSALVPCFLGPTKYTVIVLKSGATLAVVESVEEIEEKIKSSKGE
jgi:hypothetical protein